MIMSILLAQTASPTSGTDGLPSLVGNLGSAAAVVIVVYYFLQKQKSDQENQVKLVERMDEIQEKSQDKFQAQIERLSTRSEQGLDLFKDQIGRLAVQQNDVIRDVISTIKGVEQTVTLSSQTVKLLQEAITDLRTSVRALDHAFHTSRCSLTPSAHSKSIEGKTEDSTSAKPLEGR